MIVHPIGMMRAATGGGGNPAIVGVADYGNTAFTSSAVIPFHASVSEGDPVLVALIAQGAETTVTPPAGWTLVGSRLVVIAGNTWGEVYKGTAAAAQTSLTLTLGATKDLSGASIAFDSGTVDATTQKILAGVTSGSSDTVTINEGAAVATIIFGGGRDSGIVTTPTALLTHQPSNKSTSRCISISAVTEQSAGTSTAVSFTGAFTNFGLITIEVEPA